MHKCACKCEPGMCVYEDVLHVHVKENTFLCVHAQCVFIYFHISKCCVCTKNYQVPAGRDVEQQGRGIFYFNLK